MIRSLLPYFPNKCSSPTFFIGSEVSFSTLSDTFLSPSLFGGEPFLIVDEAEKMEKKDLGSLADLVSRIQYGYLICGVRAKSGLTVAFEKSGMVLDLLDEKPWEKERRLTEQMAIRVSRFSKRLGSDAMALLFERLGVNGALLDQEIDKLVCYVGERPTIERSDIFRVSAASRTYTLWQIAEEIVWKEGGAPIDSASFHGLIPAIRSQLQLGLKLVELSAAHTPRDQWSIYLPKIWPKTLEKRSVKAVQFGRSYFQRGLAVLFAIELLSRSGSTSEEALLDFFRVSLHGW